MCRVKIKRVGGSVNQESQTESRCCPTVNSFCCWLLSLLLLLLRKIAAHICFQLNKWLSGFYEILIFAHPVASLVCSGPHIFHHNNWFVFSPRVQIRSTWAAFMSGVRLNGNLSGKIWQMWNKNVRNRVQKGRNMVWKSKKYTLENQQRRLACWGCG